MNVMVLYVVSFLVVYNAVFVQAGGGNLFVTDSVAGSLVMRHGIHCTKTTAATPVYTVTLKVYEFDNNFRDDDGNIQHFDCEIAKSSSARAGTLETPGDLSGCDGSSKMFSTVDGQSASTIGPIDVSQQRTHYKTITVNTDVAAAAADTEIECGGEYILAISDMVFSAFCYREIRMNHEHDRVFHFEMDTSDCILEEYDTGNIVVDNPSETVIPRDYIVSLKFYSLADATSRDPFSVIEEESPAAQELTGPVALGTAIYAEACIAIDDSRLYFVDEHSILGLQLYDCFAVPDSTGNQFFNNPVPVGVSASDGCGLNQSPMRAWETTLYQFRFAKGDTDANMPWYSSPNCFRSDAFEAVSFSRSNINVKSTVILTCSVSYCRTIDDVDCFGTVNIAGSAYPGDDYSNQCTVRRKRRSSHATEIPESLPRTVTFNYTVITQFENEQSDHTVDAASGCFEKPVFITLSLVLASLIVIVLCVDVLLGLRLMSRKGTSPKGSTMTSSSSMTGIKNKLFY